MEEDIRIQRMPGFKAGLVFKTSATKQHLPIFLIDPDVGLQPTKSTLQV